MPPKHVVPAKSLQEGSGCTPPSANQDLGTLEAAGRLPSVEHPVWWESFEHLPPAQCRGPLPTLLTQEEEMLQPQTGLLGTQQQPAPPSHDGVGV